MARDVTEHARGLASTSCQSPKPLPNNEMRDDECRGLFGLAGQVAVVTGGLGRLGRQYVRILAEAGARVAVLDLAGALDPFDDLATAGHKILVQHVDLTRKTDVDAAFDRVVTSLGTPTILVNNAGMGSSPASAGRENGPFEDYPEEAWDTMIDSHLKSALFASQAFVRHFRISREAPRPAGAALPTGSIINVSSTYGVVSPDQAIYDFKRRDGATYFKPVGYSVAKSGVLNFTRWLAEYGGPLGIRANTLVPGGVREADHHPDFVREYERRTPLGRMAAEGDYNGAVLFLASNASAYMTGATVIVDGGWTAR